MKQDTKILIVDDKPQNLFTLAQLLARLDVEVVKAASGYEALDLALVHDFCLAIVDVQMPEMDGYELVELLRSSEMTAALPVIFVSAIFSDEYHHRRGYEAGAVDFMSKPFNPDILLSKVRIFLQLYHQRVELEEKNRMLAKLVMEKDRFFSIVAHDLRSPFNPLLGMAKLMTRLPDSTPFTEFKTMAESVYFSARSVYDLLENLLAWSRLQRGRMEYEPEQLDLKTLADRNASLFAEVAADKGIRLENTVAAGVSVRADQNMLNAILRNLMSNALKFTPRGGRVTISALPDTADAGRVAVAVSDTGVGIRPADQAKLFRLDVTHSTRGTAEEKGTGLGLIICQEMAAKNGGRIWIESEGQAGRGTTVKFTLPLLEAPPAGWEVRVEAVEAGAGRGEPEMEMLADLPPAERTVVRDLALRGDMRAIEEWTAHIERWNEQYAPLASRMRALTRDFEEGQLLALVEQYVGQT